MSAASFRQDKFETLKVVYDNLITSNFFLLLILRTREFPSFPSTQERVGISLY